MEKERILNKCIEIDIDGITTAGIDVNQNLQIEIKSETLIALDTFRIIYSNRKWSVKHKK